MQPPVEVASQSLLGDVSAELSATRNVSCRPALAFVLSLPSRAFSPLVPRRLFHSPSRVHVPIESRFVDNHRLSGAIHHRNETETTDHRRKCFVTTVLLRYIVFRFFSSRCDTVLILIFESRVAIKFFVVDVCRIFG